MHWDIQTIVQSIAILIVGGFVAWQRVQEIRRTRHFGLEGNPERCNQHKEAIDELKDKGDKIDERLRVIEGDVRAIKTKMGM